ncbi:hypothetical protein RUM44_006969 [Polyplax serrata]|uniref:T-box domain-containing protein n=1 Tax=Polyplax serrata TaxID=468196 RepID=A0ABR1B110_POLSC
MAKKRLQSSGGGRSRDEDSGDRVGTSAGRTRPTEDSETEQDVVEEEEEVEVDVEECSDSENVSVKKHGKNNSERSPVRTGSDTSSEQGEERGRDTPDSADEKVGAGAKVKIRCNCEELLMVDCHLETKDLWDKFHDLGTEMIITKTGSVTVKVFRHGQRKLPSAEVELGETERDAFRV